ncbi:hypothetical protein MRX96_006576 [Rhipicephalus microplus]
MSQLTRSLYHSQANDSLDTRIYKAVYSDARRKKPVLPLGNGALVYKAGRRVLALHNSGERRLVPNSRRDVWPEDRAGLSSGPANELCVAGSEPMGPWHWMACNERFLACSYRRRRHSSQAIYAVTIAEAE